MVEAYDKQRKGHEPLMAPPRIDTGREELDEMFSSILINSYQFWTTIQQESLQDTIGPSPPGPPDWAEKLASYGTDFLVGLGCILSMPMTCGWSIAGLVASTTASLAAECTFNDVWNWVNEVLGPPEPPDTNP